MLTQVGIFARTVLARYQQLFGRDAEIPSDGYPGDYVIALAQQIKDEEGDAYLNDTEPSAALRRRCVSLMIEIIRDEVSGDFTCIACFAGRHNFGRTGKHIDGAIESYEALGSSYVEISGSNNLVDTRQARRTVGKRCNSVCSSDSVKLRDPEKMCRGQCFTGRLRGDRNDARHTRYLCGDGGHQQRGRQRMASTGDVATNGRQRTYNLPCQKPGHRRVTPRLRKLALCKLADLSGRSQKCSTHGGISRVPG